MSVSCQSVHSSVPWISLVYIALAYVCTVYEVKINDIKPGSKQKNLTGNNQNISAIYHACKIAVSLSYSNF